MNFNGIWYSLSIICISTSILGMGTQSPEEQLLAAITSDTLSMAQEALDRGADSNGISPEGIPVLSEAILHKSAAIVEVLINRGADINKASPSGYTPLHHAISQFQPEIIQVLLNHNANVLAQALNGMTPLRLIQRIGDLNEKLRAKHEYWLIRRHIEQRAARAAQEAQKKYSQNLTMQLSRRY